MTEYYPENHITWEELEKRDSVSAEWARHLVLEIKDLREQLWKANRIIDRLLSNE